jgi:antitoxin component HigA of HigAB toxin-antitoxin module
MESKIGISQIRNSVEYRKALHQIDILYDVSENSVEYIELIRLIKLVQEWEKKIKDDPALI